MFVYHILWPLRFGWLLILCLFKEDYLQIFKCVFLLTAVSVNKKVKRSLIGLTTPVGGCCYSH